jgi:hypothetical protein
VILAFLPLHGDLRFCGGERDWRTEGRKLYARGDTGVGEDGRYIVDKGLGVTSS